MKLYYKEWDKPEVEIPQGIVSIFGEPDRARVNAIGSYPIGVCWEVWVIRKVLNNEEGFFDFNKSIVDIGACLGEYCWLLPFNYAYAFEPNKTSLYRMHTNLVLHDKVDTVDTFNCMLSDKRETVRFDGFFTDIGGQDTYDDTIATECKTKTLDEFGLDNIGLIKIDVEGMEEKVLKGGIGTIIRNNYPPILFECWDVGYTGMTQEKHDSLFNFLNSLGYEILEHWGDFETHLAIHK